MPADVVWMFIVQSGSKEVGHLAPAVTLKCLQSCLSP